MKIAAIYILTTLISTGSLYIDELKRKYPTAFLETPQIIEHYGYNAETHSVTTDDGYILTIHRIPSNSSKATYKGPVILTHGNLVTSAIWVIAGQNVSLACLLSDEGYDVWFSNLRGNWYSRSHLNLSNDSPDFWSFSFHENGVYDLASITDYVLNITKSDDVIHIGHSLGSAALYVLLSMKPKYNEKTRVLVTMSPALSYNFKLPATPFIKIEDLLVGNREVLPKNIPDTATRVFLCQEDSITHELCNYYAFYALGSFAEHIDQANVANIIAHYPAGACSRIYAHYLQTYTSGKFGPFDYGPEKNLKLYGQEDSPAYPLKGVTAPTVIIYGEYDYLVTSKEVAVLTSTLTNVVEVNRLEGSGHADLLYGKNARSKVYKYILQVLQKYSSQTKT